MLVIKDYTLSKPLYQSKHYNIYRAVRDADQLKVVIKICGDEQPSVNELSALQHEYQLLQDVDIPHIIKTYALIKHQHQLGIVLEDINGLSLHEYLEKQALSLPDFFQIALPIIQALSTLHSHQIIHKDINPNNIIINPETKEVRLIDFGISSELSRETQENVPLSDLEGTLAYLSPEQTGRMNRALDYRTDFYSLGVSFFEMLTGRLPFIAEDPLELVHCHLVKKPPAITSLNQNVPAIVEAIILKLMAKVPEDRYASASGLLADLSECQAQWQAHQSIKGFILGEKDIHDQLSISQRLYGREQEVKQLLLAFDRINQGKSELILVSGYSGIGKTALIKEISKPLTRQKGHFVSGKFALLKRTTPYSAIIEIFEDLVKRLLAEPQEKLVRLRDDLQKALGANGQVIIDVIPKVVHILGEQPPIAELLPNEAQNRFMLSFQNFVRVLSKPEHPLVLFLDDLQWADSASLHLINLLLNDLELHYFLIIGAYRDNEVTPDHALIVMAQQLEKTGLLQTTINLPALAKSNVQALLVDTLDCNIDQVEDLAELLIEKTDGNPFFINEFLKKFYQDKLLQFSYQERVWQWDIEQIKQQAMADNVVDLLSARINELPEDALHLLRLAACIGHSFDLHTLAIISSHSVKETAQALWPAILANLISPIDNQYRKLSASFDEDGLIGVNNEKVVYRFIHDRIQQAAYQFIEVSERQQIHLSISRILVERHGIEERSEHLFSILNHYNQGLDLITDLTEKRTVSAANLLAGRKAKAATAYHAAKEYLKAGISLLTHDSLQLDYDFSFALHQELVECEFVTAEFAKAELLIDKLLACAKTNLDKANLYQLQLALLNTQGRLKEALDLGLHILENFGMRLPKKIKTFHILKSILEIKWAIGHQPIPDFKLTPLSNPDIQIIHAITRPLFMIAYDLDNRPLFLLLAAKCLNLSLRYGYVQHTPYLLLTYGSILINLLKRYREGFAFVALAEKLIASLPQATYHPGSGIILSAFINLYRYPFADVQASLMQSYDSCLEVGDFSFANACLVMYVTYSFIHGKPLSELDKECDILLSFKARTKATNYNGVATKIKEISHYLQDHQLMSLPDSEMIAEIEKKDNNSEKALIFCNYLQLYYVLGDFKRAILMADKYDQPKTPKSSYVNVAAVFYTALAYAACFQEVELKERHHFLKKIHTYYKQIKGWASLCPANFLYYRLLLAAEIARIENKPLQAMSLYDEAIDIVKQNENFRLLAIASECAARFYLQLGREFTVKAYLQQAHYAYTRWGAYLKANKLMEQYPNYLQNNINYPSIQATSTTTITGTQQSLAKLDILSLFKSTRAISSEIELKGLLEKLVTILMENAGTQRCLLLTKDKGDWYVDAEGTLESKKIYLEQIEPLSNRDDIPITMINFSERTMDMLVIKNKKEWQENFHDDVYLNAVEPESILILPFVYQGRLRSLLYLENRTAHYAFTAEHVNTLQLLASQAAISLENARLYHQATHDPLTGLANRSLLLQSFNQAIEKIKSKNILLAILFLDLDGFKHINDTLGHEVGDKLLQYFSQHLKGFLRDGDLAVRLGGDEFVLMLEKIEDINQIETIASRLLENLIKPVSIMGHEIIIRTSIGISLYPKTGKEIDELLRQADNALYQVKARSKGECHLKCVNSPNQISCCNSKGMSYI